MRKLWQSLFGGARRDQDLDAELEAHLGHEIDARIAAGETPVEASRNARLAFGNVTMAAEATRATWPSVLFTGLSQDLRFAFRLMRKNPVFTLAAVSSLALGIGANTAVFSLYDRVLLSNLPVERPDEIYQLAFRTSRDQPDRPVTSHTYPFIQQLQQRSQTLAGVGCTSGTSASFRSGAESRILRIEMVCGNLFELLGVKAHIGRMLQPEDNLEVGGHPVLVLAYHFWRSEFGGDPAIVGRTIELNRQPFTIVGVAPANYFSTAKGNLPSLFAPIVMDGVFSGRRSSIEMRDAWWIRVLARKKVTSTPAQAEAELTSMLKAYRQSTLDGPRSENAKQVEASLQVVLQPAARGENAARQDARYGPQFAMLLAVVGAVLLIACINIANLLLARAAARQREIATRLAIGASRARLIRQFLTESLLLAALGGVGGVLLAFQLERILTREAFGATALVGLSEGPAWQVLLFCLATTLLAGVAFGIAPALTADRQALRSAHRLTGRKLLVSLQVALSVLLLMTAGLFLKTVQNLRSIDAGFVRENLITMRLTPRLAGKSEEAALAYFRGIESRLQQYPGIRAVSFNSMGLLSDSEWSRGIQIAGVSPPEGERSPLHNSVGAGFFSMIGAAIVEGRDFGPEDLLSRAAKVAVVNQTFARRYFGHSSALGRYIGPGTSRGSKEVPEFRVVGVVKDLHDTSIQGESMRYWYSPYSHEPQNWGMNLTARTAGDPLRMISAIRAEISRIDPTVPISEAQTMSVAVEEQIRQQRLIANVSLFFAIVAVLLAVIGLYGVMAYTVERRSKEIGIRLALGEERGQVLSKILREALLYIAIGVVSGVPMAIGLGHFATKLLYGVKPLDMPSLAVAVLVISSFGVLAGWVTARRAAGIDPMQALRVE